MDNRTIERFKIQSILMHWLHAGAFAILAITGGLMLFRVNGFYEGHTIRIIHNIAAAIFMAVPIIYSVVYPIDVIDFIKETFHWKKVDRLWLRKAPVFYFGGKDIPPPEDRLNGDQKLWQVIVVLTCLTLVVTGIILSLFRMSISVQNYEVILLAHGTAFFIVLLGFMIHFYLTSFYPYFNESLNSMIDGKVSPTYAQKHYPEWYEKAAKNQP